MPGTVNLATMVTRVRRRADMENTTFVTDAEIEEYVEASLGELIDLMLEEGGGDWMLTATQGQSTAAGTDTYQIYTNDIDMANANVYKVLGVEVQFNGKWRRLRRFSHWQGSRLEDLSGWTSENSVYYKVLWQPTMGADAKIQFEPAPQGVHTFRVLYIPYPSDWSSGGFTNFLGFTGWEEYVIVDAAMKCLEKEESDTKHLMVRLARLQERIRHHAKTMNYGEGDAIRDVSANTIFGDDLLPWETA